MPVRDNDRYGPQHRKERARLVNAYRRGDPCALCGQPMTDHPRLLDLAHVPGTTTWAGLAHRACNRGDAARLGNRTRTGKYDPEPKPWTTNW